MIHDSHSAPVYDTPSYDPSPSFGSGISYDSGPSVDSGGGGGIDISW